MDYALKTKIYNGKLSKGCLQCVKGEKLVLFATGLCPRNCFYCPISERKKNIDIVYANEMPLKNKKHAAEIIREAEMMDAKGAGITGGDPLARINRTCAFIRALKKHFGKKFHIHLYTSLNLITKKNLSRLERAGLDELRLHPDIYDDRLWKKIDIIKGYNFDVGVEIPVIPGAEKQIIKLISFFRNKVDFFNLNELEISEININKYISRKLHTKKKYSYAVKGSEELAKKLVKKYPMLNIHYCSASFKDKIQMGRRILRRAKNVKRDFDIITDEGMLVRGAIYGKNLEKTIAWLKKDFHIPKSLLFHQKSKRRILTSIEVVKRLSGQLKKKGLKPAIVEEYPTFDEMPVSVDFV